MKPVHRLVIAALALGGLSTALPAQAVLVAPHLITLTHAERGGVVNLYNPGDRPIEVELGLGYGVPTVDSVGEFTLELGSTGPRDASTWLAPYPRRLRLAPLQRQTIRLHATPPAALGDGEYWARLVVSARADKAEEGQPTAADRIAIGLGLEVRTVLPVLYRKGSPSVAPTLGEVTMARSGDSLLVSLPLAPVGDAAFLGTATLTLLDADAQPVQRAELPLSLYQAAEPIVRIAALDPRARSIQVRVAAGREDLEALPVLPSAPITRTFAIPTP